MNEDEIRHFSTLTLCTLSGLGGVGKTTLVTEFAYKYRRFYQFICWLDASTKKDFFISCISLHMNEVHLYILDMVDFIAFF